MMNTTSYLKRMGIDTVTAVDEDLLKKLHRQHVWSIPFYIEFTGQANLEEQEDFGFTMISPYLNKSYIILTFQVFIFALGYLSIKSTKLQL